MDDRRYRFDPTTPRAAGRVGALLTAALAVALLAICTLTDLPPEVDDEAAMIAAGAAAGLALVLWFVPWRWLGRASPLAVPVLIAAGLVAVDEVSELSRAAQSLAFYPPAWFVALALVGLTQPRFTTLALSPVVAVSALLVTLPDRSVIPPAVVAVTIPAAVLVGEAAAWALAGIRLGLRIERRREQDIRTLAGSVGVLRDHKTTLEDTAGLLARLAHEVFHGDHVTVVLRAQDGRLVPTSVGTADAAPSEQTGELVARAIEDAEVRLIAENGTTLLIIPLVGATEIGGAVVVRQPRTGDDPFTQQLAVLFASQAGPALEQIQVIGRLSEDLRRDEKTGIGNSRHAEALVQSLTAGDAVVYIDLDDFRAMNKRYTHAGADLILREFSTLLSSSVREADLTARVGGDEFIFLARKAELDALPAANRLLEAWRRTGTDRSFSAGVAIHQFEDLPELTLKHADQACYRAKKEGRNRVCLYPPGGWLGGTDDDGMALKPDDPPPSPLPPARRRDDS